MFGSVRRVTTTVPSFEQPGMFHLSARPSAKRERNLQVYLPLSARLVRLRSALTRVVFVCNAAMYVGRPRQRTGVCDLFCWGLVRRVWYVHARVTELYRQPAVFRSMGVHARHKHATKASTLLIETISDSSASALAFRFADRLITPRHGYIVQLR